MKRTLKFVAFMFCFLPFFGYSKDFSAPLACPELEEAELTALLHKFDTVELVFFSTWCGDCLPKLKQMALPDAELKDGGRLFVAVFDKRSRVERTLRSLNLSLACRMDNGIAKKLNVKSVPAVRLVRRGDLP